jgi:hypothetical protein
VGRFEQAQKIRTCSKLLARVYWGGRAIECDGADCGGGGLELDPDDELLLPEFEEELEDEFDEDELEPDDEPDEDEPDEPEFEDVDVDEPEPLPELDEDEPELWSELW